MQKRSFPRSSGGRAWSVVVLLLCVLAPAAAESEQAQKGSGVASRWGGASSPNMVSAAVGLPADISDLEPLWRLRLGTHQYSIPSIDGGRMYLGINDARFRRAGFRSTGGGVLMCIEQATGKPIWSLPSPRYFEGVKPPYHFNQWKCGFCSGPLVDGDRVYVVGGRGEILCLDADGQADGNEGPFVDELEYMGIHGPEGAKLQDGDGDIVWRFSLIPEVDVVPHDVCGSTLLLVGEYLYACTSNGIDDRHDKIPRPLAPSLIVLEKKTGRLVARDGEKIGTRMFHGHWSSPSAGRVAGKTLVFFGGGDGILYAFEPPRPSGAGSEVQVLKKVWSYDCNPPAYRFQDGKPAPYSAHNRRTPTGPSEIIGTSVFHEGRVYVTIGQSPIHGRGQGRLCCVDAATGRELWASKLVDRSLATVSIADGLLYVSDYSGRLHCFDATAGKRYWVHDLEAPAWQASTLVADGKVYAGTEAGTLWVLAAARERRVLSEAQLQSAPITPVAVDGILYVATQKDLAAYPGESGGTAAAAR